MTLAGGGCEANKPVTVLAVASHATGRTLAESPASSSGTFSITVRVPFMGEPTAEVVADCQDPLGQKPITPADIPIKYTAPPYTYTPTLFSP